MDEKMPGDRFIETLRGLRDGKTLTELEEAMSAGSGSGKVPRVRTV